MRRGWLISVVVVLGLVAWGLGVKWWNRGIEFGDFGYAGLMVGFGCAAFWLAARITREAAPVFSRFVVGVAALLGGSALVSHYFRQPNYREAIGNGMLLAVILAYSYVELIRRPRAEQRRVRGDGAST